MVNLIDNVFANSFSEVLNGVNRQPSNGPKIKRQPSKPEYIARLSVAQSHLLIMAEGEQNMNDFLTRISGSKQDLNGC